ncbi:MAG: hypothetical protein KA407_02955 [Spirochaetes bacterium]|nr:hypothetical protein [Spirochaetota bacterium]HOM87160.1 hypothetical protein [Spirochaetota bacterium]HQG43642.1 hypothetical protein [Spirochaetota bacterium]
MKILKSHQLYNSIIIVVSSLLLSGFIMLLYCNVDYSRTIIVAITASFSLISWRKINASITDYVTNGDAPIATLTMIAMLILTRSLSLSIIAAFIILFLYHYFFLPFQRQDDSALLAFLFTAILLFIMYFASNRMIPIPVPLHTLFCAQSIPSSPIMAFIVVISITLYMFIKQLRYEFTIITLGKDYFTILGVSKTSIELLKAFITTLAAMIAIILAGWLGAFFYSMPFLSKTNDVITLIVLALCITLLLYVSYFVNPFSVIIPLIITDFCFLAIVTRRMPCSR